MTTDRYSNLATNARRTVSQFRMPTHPVAKVAVVALSVVVALAVARLALGLIFGVAGLLFGLLKIAFVVAVPLLLVVGVVVLVKALLK